MKRFLHFEHVPSRDSLKKALGILQIMEFSFLQSGQVKWIAYPDLVPMTVGLTELVFIKSLLFYFFPIMD